MASYRELYSLRKVANNMIGKWLLTDNLWSIFKKNFYYVTRGTGIICAPPLFLCLIGSASKSLALWEWRLVGVVLGGSGAWWEWRLVGVALEFRLL